MSSLEYSFGSGDGSLTTWTSTADIDLGGRGRPDAVSLDFDGDGIADDAMWDTNGDGIADLVALDVDDDDGIPDRFFADPQHLGVWDHEVGADDSHVSNGDLHWTDRGGVDHIIGSAQPELIAVDYDGDGILDDAVFTGDHDGAGAAILVGAPEPDTGYAGLLVRHPDLSLVDTDRDGILDRVIRSGEPGYLGS